MKLVRLRSFTSTDLFKTYLKKPTFSIKADWRSAFSKDFCKHMIISGLNTELSAVFLKHNHESLHYGSLRTAASKIKSCYT